MIEQLLERWLSAVGRVAHRRAGWIVLVGLASLLPAGWLAMGVEVRSSFLDLLPPEDQAVVQLREVLAHARSTSDVVVAVSTEDPEMADAFAEALASELEADPEVAGIGGRTHREWFRDHQILFVPEADLEGLVTRAEAVIDHEVMERSGFDLGLDDEVETPEALLRDLDARTEGRLGSEDWLRTEDGRFLILWAYFAGNSGDIEFGDRAWTRVRDAVDRLRDGERFSRDLEVNYAGGIPGRVEDQQSLVADLRIAGTVGFVGVVMLIVLSLRTPRALVLLSVPLFVGLVWTFAFARLAIGHLNIISGFLFSILSGLGIEYGIHLIHRYRELREEGLGLDVAIERLVATTGRALLAGSLTNAGVFAVIALARFRGFSEFGTIAAVGLLLTLVATLLGLPALIVVLERARPMPMPEPAADAEVRAPLRIPAAARWSVVLGVPLLGIASLGVLGAGGVVFDGNWRALVSDTEVSRFMDYLRHETADYTQGLLWVEHDTDLAQVEAAIDATREERLAAGRSFDLVDVVTLADVYPSPETQSRRAVLARRLRAQLDRIRPGTVDDETATRLDEGRATLDNAQPFTVDDMPYSIVGQLRTRDGQGSIVHLRAPQTDDPSTGYLISWSDQAEAIETHLREADVHAPMLSENWVAGEIFDRIRADAPLVGAATLLAVLLVLWLDVRRVSSTLGIFASVLLGMACLAGLCWATGLRFNFMNIAILPVCMSISLDNAIHVFHRWRQGGRGSIGDVLRHTTKSNALASATNLLGFAALALAHHGGLRSVAYLATLGVIATYVTTTIWFPFVLDTIDQWRGPAQPAARTGEPEAPIQPDAPAA